MHESIADLNLRKVFVICPGDRRYSLDEKIEVVPVKHLVGFNPLTA
jgi:hypothetical protein